MLTLLFSKTTPFLYTYICRKSTMGHHQLHRWATNSKDHFHIPVLSNSRNDNEMCVCMNAYMWKRKLFCWKRRESASLNAYVIILNFKKYLWVSYRLMCLTVSTSTRPAFSFNANRKQFSTYITRLMWKQTTTAR